MTDAEFVQLRNVCGTVSRETFDRLKIFEAEFRRWSKAINLASGATQDKLWQRHVIDSAQLCAIKPEARKWLDLGSGGGFPGAVIAIMLHDVGNADVHLVESNAKKAAFLQATLGRLAPRAKVHRSRIEDALPLAGEPEIVTARALAPLGDLLGLASPWLRAGATGLFHKGRDYAREIEESRSRWTCDLVEHRSGIDPESRILEVSNLQPRVCRAEASQ